MKGEQTPAHTHTRNSHMIENSQTPKTHVAAQYISLTSIYSSQCAKYSNGRAVARQEQIIQKHSS